MIANEIRLARLEAIAPSSSSSGIAGAVPSMECAFGRGPVMTRTRLEARGDVLMVPAAVILAGLVERTERKLSALYRGQIHHRIARQPPAERATAS